MRQSDSAGGMTALMHRGLAMLLVVPAVIGGMPDKAQGQIVEGRAQIRIQVQGGEIQVPNQGNDAEEAEEKKGNGGGKPQAAENPAEVQRRQQIRQLANHWEQQFTKLLYGDLELLRAVCGDLPRESRRAISRAGEQAVKDAALRTAELQMGGRQGRAMQGAIRIQGGGAVVNGVARAINNVIVPPKPPRRGDDGAAPDENNAANPPGMLAAALTKSVAEHAGKERAAAFTDELARRKDRRREAMIREVVAALDGELVLTAEQRQAIERSLREQWDDSMAMMLQGMHMHNGVRVFPGLPEGCVRPHLNAAQRERFGAQPRGNNRGQANWQQVWMQSVNLLNNMPSAGRDPWWFE